MFGQKWNSDVWKNKNVVGDKTGSKCISALTFLRLFQKNSIKCLRGPKSIFEMTNNVR
jgi:hypothetical protein